MFTSFMPAASREALTAMALRVRRWRLHMWVRRDLDELAAEINPIVAGWMNYYGRFYRSAAHQHLPDALGWQEVQTAAVLQTIQGVVVWDPRSRPCTVRALAVGPHVRRTSMRRAE